MIMKNKVKTKLVLTMFPHTVGPFPSPQNERQLFHQE